MPSYLNSILLEGNIVDDPTLRVLPSGTKVCSIQLASHRFYKKENKEQEEVSYFEIESWGRLAEKCAEYLKKGREVRIVGRLKQDRWADKEGLKHSKVKIVAEHVEFKPIFKEAQKDKSQENMEY